MLKSWCRYLILDQSEHSVPLIFFFFIKLCLCQERLVTNWLDALDTAACLTGFIFLRHWPGCPQTLQAWPWPSDLPFLHLPSTGIAGLHQQSIYVVLETKPRAWSTLDMHSSNWATSPVLRTFTVFCSISNTTQWLESNSSKNNLCKVSIRRGSKFHDTQFSDPQRVVLLTLYDLLLSKEYHANGNVTQWQSPCLVCTEPLHYNNQANKEAVWYISSKENFTVPK